MMWTLAALIGYALGSVPFAYLGARWFAGIDIRQTGSGNVGAANVLRNTRWSVGLAVLALDMGKGALAAWVGERLGGPAGAAIGAVASVVGHVYPIWLGFVGGKGVATGAGAFLWLAPQAALGTIVAFAVIVWRTSYVSLASMVAAILLPILAAFTDETATVVAAGAAVGAIVLFRHRENLARLRAGTERRLGQRDWPGAS
jgi:glycerol-3-phosphate acyltransferase PlsY